VGPFSEIFARAEVDKDQTPPLNQFDRPETPQLLVEFIEPTPTPGLGVWGRVLLLSLLLVGTWRVGFLAPTVRER
jgi:hypothetical protein